jgi:hypothetical protein
VHKSHKLKSHIKLDGSMDYGLDTGGEKTNLFKSNSFTHNN